MPEKYNCIYCGTKTTNTNGICVHCGEKLQLIRKLRSIVFGIKHAVERKVVMGMSPKKYLDQIRRLRILIDQRQKELDRLTEQKLSSVSGIDYGKIPVQGGRRVGASFEQAAIQSLDLREEIAGLIREYTELRHKIIGQIQQLDRPEYLQVLYKRYVEEKRWEEISVEMGYSCDHIRHLHGYALREFSKSMKDNTQ